LQKTKRANGLPGSLKKPGASGAPHPAHIDKNFYNFIFIF